MGLRLVAMIDGASDWPRDQSVTRRQLRISLPRLCHGDLNSYTRSLSFSTIPGSIGPVAFWAPMVSWGATRHGFRPDPMACRVRSRLPSSFSNRPHHAKKLTDFTRPGNPWTESLRSTCPRTPQTTNPPSTYGTQPRQRLRTFNVTPRSRPSTRSSNTSGGHRSIMTSSTYRYQDPKPILFNCSHNSIYGNSDHNPEI